MERQSLTFLCARFTWVAILLVWIIFTSLNVVAQTPRDYNLDAKIAVLDTQVVVNTDRINEIRAFTTETRAMVNFNTNRLTKLESEYVSMTEAISAFTWWFRAVAVMIGSQLLVAAWEIAKAITARKQK